MNPVLTMLIDKGTSPSRADLAELLASIGKPGEKLAEKEEAVRQLYDESGHRAENHQGVHVTEILDSFREF